jgi:hypothetical protein
VGFALLEAAFHYMHGRGGIFRGPCRVLLSSGIAVAVSSLADRVPVWAPKHGWGALARSFGATGERMWETVRPRGSEAPAENLLESEAYAGADAINKQTLSQLRWDSPDLHRLILARMPVGYAHVRLEGIVGDGRDFVVVECNAQFHDIFHGWTTVELTAAQRWPGMLKPHQDLFAALGAVTPDTPQSYTGWFAEQGRSIEFQMTSLKEDHVLVTMRDVSDEQLYREEVMRMHEQHIKVMEARDTREVALTTISDNFVRYSTEVLYGPYDVLEQFVSFEGIPEDRREDGLRALAELQTIIQYSIKFSGVASVDYQPSLVNMQRIFDDLFRKQQRTNPGNPLKSGPLPSTTAAPDVARALLSELLDLANRYLVKPGSELRMGVRTENLESVYYLLVSHAAHLELVPGRAGGVTFPDGPPAIHLMVCHRLAASHGGRLQVRELSEEDSGFGELGDIDVEFSFTLGTPFLPKRPAHLV